ncbi:MAG: asparagine synthase-related protein, partial [Candidatus Acidiferrum sp.]
MSGFFGMLRQDGKPVETGLLERIATEMSFRGPDANHVWVRGNVGGCFTLMRTGPAKQASRQPFLWAERFWLWGDLRLDGRKQLEEQLGDEHRSVNAETTSEEFLVRAWAKWGSACLERVIGDFSFGLWDTQEQTQWCARDFVGAHPFYYARVNGLFCFSNTLEMLRRVPDISPELDEAFVGDFLIEGWNAEPSRTVYKNIKRLPAGHLLKFADNAFDVHRFRKLPIEEPLQLKHPEEYLEEYRRLLNAAVEDRLAENATALYLSGGLDSSAVCATAVQIARARGQKEKLKAFTVSWEQFYDDPEARFAKVTARHLGITQEVLQEAELRAFEDSECEMGRTPEPNGEVFFAREKRMAEKIAAHANVVLSGDGGDDVLTGQAWPYLTHLWRNGEWNRMVQDFGGYFWTHKSVPPIGGGFRTRFRKMANKRDRYLGYPVWINPAFEMRANLRQRWLDLQNQPQNIEHPLHPLAYGALHHGFWAVVLETEDAGWNRARLESRAPLLDMRMLTFLLRLPPVPWCMNKELCRRALKGELPREIIERPKTPATGDPISKLNAKGLIAGLCTQVPGRIEEFVNWRKWCETLSHSEGSLTLASLRPASLF